jgi:hypothetical protein
MPARSGVTLFDPSLSQNLRESMISATKGGDTVAPATALGVAAMDKRTLARRACSVPPHVLFTAPAARAAEAMLIAALQCATFR